MGKQEVSKIAYEVEEAISLLRRKHPHPDDNSNLKNSERFFLMMIDKLSKEDSVTPSDIAKKFGVTLAAITHHINSLEEQKLIKREASTEDRRVTYITLSRKGQKKVDEIKKGQREMIYKLVEYLGEEESRHLISIISKINEFAEKRKENQ